MLKSLVYWGYYDPERVENRSHVKKVTSDLADIALFGLQALQIDDGSNLQRQKRTTHRQVADKRLPCSLSPPPRSRSVAPSSIQSSKLVFVVRQLYVRHSDTYTCIAL